MAPIAKRLSHIKIKHKFVLPTIVQAGLIGIAVAYFALNTATSFSKILQAQGAVEEASEAVSNAVTSAERALESGGVGPTLPQVMEKIEIAIKAISAVPGIETSVRLDLEAMRDGVQGAAPLVEDNAVIIARIFELTENSIEQSNTYIKEVSAALVDPEREDSVTPLQRAVLAGANVNTTANFRVQVLTLSMLRDLSRKTDLIHFLDTAISNAIKDAEKLAGTPFLRLPQAAEAANREAKQLVTRYVENVEHLQSLRGSILQKGRSVSARVTQTAFDGARRIKSQLVRSGWMLAILLVVTFALGIVVAWLIAREATRSLARVTAALTRQGDSSAADLTDVENRKDELGEVLRAAIGVVEKIRFAGGKVRDASLELAATAEQLSVTTSQMSERNSVVSGEAQMVASATEEMGVTVDSVAYSSSQVSDSTEQAYKAAENGAKVVGQAVLTMRQVAEVVQEGADTVVNLGQRSERIGLVMRVIEDVADQTNLLALNAAIEAARAGEHGRGFAVVADEVRKLAEKTVKATGEISETIRAIQDESRKAVDSMERATKVVNEGASLAEQAGTAIDTVEEQIHAASDQTQQIASATQQLASAIHSAVSSVDQIAQGVRQNSSDSGGIAATAGTLAEKAGELRDVMQQLLA